MADDDDDYDLTSKLQGFEVGQSSSVSHLAPYSKVDYQATAPSLQEAPQNPTSSNSATTPVADALSHSCVTPTPGVSAEAITPGTGISEASHSASTSAADTNVAPTERSEQVRGL